MYINRFCCQFNIPLPPLKTTQVVWCLSLVWLHASKVANDHDDLPDFLSWVGLYSLSGRRAPSILWTCRNHWRQHLHITWDSWGCLVSGIHIYWFLISCDHLFEAFSLASHIISNLSYGYDFHILNKRRQISQTPTSLLNCLVLLSLSLFLKALWIQSTGLITEVQIGDVSRRNIKQILYII